MRKVLAQATYHVVARGAAQWRQNADGLTDQHPVMEEKAAHS